MFKSYQIQNEKEYKNLLKTKKIYFYQEIKHIPNQILNLYLSIKDKDKSKLKSEQQGYQIKYKFETKITGTWTFRRKYNIRLKKNLTTNYDLNEKLFIKEPYVKDKDNNIFYKFDNHIQELKYKHQRFMKEEESRTYIQITNITIEKIENYYLDYENYEKSKEESPLLIFQKENNEQKTKLEQLKYSHKYQIKYECKLIKNPYFEKIKPLDKINFFYRLQIPKETSISELGYLSWEDFELGYIEATSKKEARKLLEENLNEKITMRFTKLEDMGIKYKYLLKIYPSNEYWDKYWYEERQCEICGNNYTLIDRNNQSDYKGNKIYCSKDCEDIGISNLIELKEEEEIQKRINENTGIHSPCIYKIKNKKENKVYIGQTTQYCTFRWYQHFSSSSSSMTKFHEKINKTKITDWEFEVIEIIEKKSNISKSDSKLFINKREQYWINYYDSINNGYNTATANKEESLKKVKKC